MLEELISRFYEDSAKSIGRELSEELERFSRESKDRINELTRVMQMSVIEMTLEYLEGIPFKETYKRIKDTINDDSMNTMSKALSIEKSLSNLYEVIAEKIDFMSMDAGDLLRRYALESKDRVDKLIEKHK